MRRVYDLAAHLLGKHQMALDAIRRKDAGAFKVGVEADILDGLYLLRHTLNEGSADLRERAAHL